MKTLKLSGFVFLLLLSFSCSCNLNTSDKNRVEPVPTIVGFSNNVPIDSTNVSPDAIVATPGGIAYRANVIDVGKPNPWPPIVSDNATVADLRITYRANINTPAGTTRNNIFDIYGGGQGFHNDHQIDLYAIGVPTGFKIYVSGGGGLPGEERQILTVEIGNDVLPGKYTFRIGVLFDGRRYRAIPLSINVTPA